MSLETVLTIITTLIAALGGPPLIRMILEKVLGHRHSTEEKELEARLATAEYERQREAFREDKAFDMLQESLETLGRAVEAQDRRAQEDRQEAARIYRLLDRIEQTDRVQNSILQELVRTLHPITVYVQEQQQRRGSERSE